MELKATKITTIRETQGVITTQIIEEDIKIEVAIKIGVVIKIEVVIKTEGVINIGVVTKTMDTNTEEEEVRATTIKEIQEIFTKTDCFNK